MRGDDHVDRFLSRATVEAFARECAAAQAEGRYPVGTLRLYSRFTAKTLPGGCTLISLQEGADAGIVACLAKGPGAR